MDADTEAVLAAAAAPAYHSFPTSEIRQLLDQALADGDDDRADALRAALVERGHREAARDERDGVRALWERYAPDAQAFDHLVDADGQPTAADDQPPPPPVDPVDAVDATAAVVAGVEMAEVFLIAGTGGVEDRVRLLATVTDAKARLTQVATLLGQSLASDVAEPIEVDGQWWRPDRAKSVTGWQTAAVNAAINRAVMAPVADVDPATGEPVEREPTAAEAVDRMWPYVQFAKGRTAKLRQIGVTEDEYATVRWSDVLKPEKA